MSREFIPSPLCTDLYQITMAQGYFHHGIQNRSAVFHLYFRRTPFKGGYAISAGLSDALTFLEEFRILEEHVDFLRTLCGNDGEPLFQESFLRRILGCSLELEIDAVPEGTVVFANEPLVRVTGPLWQAQWVETALLCIINFQTLIATKAARVCEVAGDDTVLEFGLRRAQGIDGGMSASRAAYLGGCAATSNVWAAQKFDIPCKGTHAHSWIMSFEDEPSAFAAYADAMPNNCVFLVDTFDTLQGVKNAIAISKSLRERGHRVVGIRLDSGDLTYLSIQARQLLDQAGFPEAIIVASNDLDEHKIERLRGDGAMINLWGVGTNLVTAADQPALGGVYKLAAIQDDHGDWTDRIKRSDDPEKASIPGIQQVRRFERDGKWSRDVIFDPRVGLPDSESVSGDEVVSVDELLQPMMKHGRLTADLPSLQEIREHAIRERKRLPPEVRRLSCSTTETVQLAEHLRQRRIAMMENAV